MVFPLWFLATYPDSQGSALMGTRIALASYSFLPDPGDFIPSHHRTIRSRPPPKPYFTITRSICAVVTCTEKCPIISSTNSRAGPTYPLYILLSARLGRANRNAMCYIFERREVSINTPAVKTFRLFQVSTLSSTGRALQDGSDSSDHFGIRMPIFPSPATIHSAPSLKI